MANDNRLYIAIVGGFWELQADQAKLAAAIQTAKEFGAELAKAGMGLVVYFSDANSLEPHLVSGYVPALAPATGKHSIRVRFAASQKNVYFSEQGTHKEVFQSIQFAGQDWEAPFFRSIAAVDRVDGVLLMAGQRSTRIAGQVAMALALPVLAVDEFGGAAADIRSELAQGDQNYPASKTHSPSESVEWLKQKCAAAAAQREQARESEKKYVRIVSQRKKAGWTACAFLALLVAVFFGVAQPPKPAFYSFLTFGGLIAAGATAALIRSVFWGSEEIAPFTSLVLGGFAGFVVGIAYLLPQYVGAPGILDSSANEVLPKDKIQFVYAVLVAISAGVGFDTIFARLKRQAEVLAIGPRGQK
jgi:hypothetical protein